MKIELDTTDLFIGAGVLVVAGIVVFLWPELWAWVVGGGVAAAVGAKHAKDKSNALPPRDKVDEEPVVDFADDEIGDDLDKVSDEAGTAVDGDDVSEIADELQESRNADS